MDSSSSISPAQRNDDIPGQSDEDVDCCDVCEESDTELYFCKACDNIFCLNHWSEQAAHNSRRKKSGKRSIENPQPLATLHEKTQLLVKRLVEPVFSKLGDDEDIKARLIEDADAAWFAVSRESGSDTPLIFHDYGRYAELMAATTNSSPRRQSVAESVSSNLSARRTPSLVSFVGEAGAGKSTLIKLLILMKAPSELTNPQCPVGGTLGGDNPTSEDVHLYLDPLSALSDTPMLYADCEGLNGGERDPLATTYHQELSSREGENQSPDDEPSLFEARYSSQRELQWAKSKTERTRDFAVSRFYPRLLFTFSDVVIFVHRNPRVVESIFEQLLDWAASALETARNQPVLPHAIIVWNATPNGSDPRLWDVDFATQRVFESLSATVNQNATFTKYAEFWRERDRPIQNVKELMMCYFSSIRVVHIPTDMQPTLLHEQAKKLYTEIEIGCQNARKCKSNLRMLLDAEELQSYLQDAFDLYSQTLDVPFDFVQASFLHNPIPFNFGGNILKLAIAMMKEEQKPDPYTIFKKLGNLVASCIMLDAVRYNVLGTASLLFPRYLKYLDEALQKFCDRYWPCEYVMIGVVPEDLPWDVGHTQGWHKHKSATVAYKCANVRIGHDSKGHQSKEGRILARGSYFSRFSFENNHETFRNGVYLRLEHLLNELSICVRNGEPQEAAATRMHGINLRDFFYRPSNRSATIDLQNRTVCWCCLFEGPEHALLCGHVLCTACVKAYGRLEGRMVVRMHGCPFESCGESRSQSIYIKPQAAGLRMLALDDGGIRSVIQLEMLRLIDKELGGNIPLRLFFDLIVGTGSSSVITLGLLNNSWTMEDCMAVVLRIFKHAFSSRNLRKFPRLKYSACKYKPKPLEESLREVFTENSLLLKVGTDGRFGALTKLAIPVMSSTSRTMMFASYIRRSDIQLPYQMCYPVDIREGIKSWEVARAAMAQPLLFQPFKHDTSKQIFGSGDRNNILANPIKIADIELKTLWGSPPSALPDIVLSLGTGVNIGQPTTSRSLESRARRIVLGRKKKVVAFDQECEKVWTDYLRNIPNSSGRENSYIRLNIQATELPALDDINALENLRNMVQTQMKTRTIQSLANNLIAKLFYFEKTSEVEMTSRRELFLRGEILCRIPDNSSEISRIGELLKKRKFKDNQFFIQEELREQQYINIPSSVIDNMIHHRQFKMPEVKISVSERSAAFNAFLRLENDEEYSISGFPRFLAEKDAQTRKHTRHGSESYTSFYDGPQWTPPDRSSNSGFGSGLHPDDRPSPMRIPSSSSGSAPFSDVPTPGSSYNNRTYELPTNDTRDERAIRYAMLIEQERDRIRREEVAPLEERVRNLEANQEKANAYHAELTTLLAGLKSPTSELPPQKDGMVSPNPDGDGDGPLINLNSANPSRTGSVHNRNEKHRSEDSGIFGNLLSP